MAGGQGEGKLYPKPWDLTAQAAAIRTQGRDEKEDRQRGWCTMGATLQLCLPGLSCTPKSNPRVPHSDVNGLQDAQDSAGAPGPLCVPGNEQLKSSSNWQRTGQLAVRA